MSIDAISNNFGRQYRDPLPSLGGSLVETLRFFSVQRAYGVGGDYAANLINALGSHIPVLPSSNELHAGFSACAEAEINGLGLCLITYTVGSLPCMSAAALARAENLAVIFLSGAPGENEALNAPIHHTVHAADQWHVEFDSALDAFKGLGIRSERLQGSRYGGQPSMAGEQFYELVRHALRHRTPVFVEVPRDLLSQPVQSIRLPDSLYQALAPAVRLTGAAAIAADIVQKLSCSKRPVLFFGERIKSNPALIAAVREFCQRRGVPYASNVFAKGILDEHSPLSLGAYNGAFSCQATRDAVEQADYLLEICSSILNHDTSTAFATATFKLDKIPSATVLKGSTANCEDVLEIFQLLDRAPLPELRAATPHPASAPELGETALAAPDDAVGFDNLAQILNLEQQQQPAAYVYLPEIGNSYFASFGLRCKQSKIGRSWLTNPWYAAMGTSLPYARATALSIRARNSDDIPVVITGDGGFHFQLNELIHFLKDDLFVIIIYMRNNVFHLGKSGDGPIYYCNDERFDLESLVNAYGGSYQLCNTVVQFQRAFRDFCTARRGICLVEVPTATDKQRQSPEIQLLNLYIQAKSGNAAAIKAWGAVE